MATSNRNSKKRCSLDVKTDDKCLKQCQRQGRTNDSRNLNYKNIEEFFFFLNIQKISIFHQNIFKFLILCFQKKAKPKKNLKKKKKKKRPRDVKTDDKCLKL